MQRPAELVPIPWCGVEALESSGKLLHFGKIPKTLGQNLAKIQQKSVKFKTKCKKSAKISAIFSEKN